MNYSSHDNKKPRDDLAIIIPVYNEAESIEAVIREWEAVLSKMSIHFSLHLYDDGSTDDTEHIIHLLRDTHPYLHYHRHSNRGHGPTILKGYNETALLSDWIFQADSDMEISAKEFLPFWEIKDHFDFIAGRRHNRSSSMVRRTITFFARNTVWFLFGEGIHDCNVPFRLMRSTSFINCFQSIPRFTFAPNVLISAFSAMLNIKTAELHISHTPRKHGTSSIRHFKLLKCTLISWLQTLQFRFRMRKL